MFENFKRKKEEKLNKIIFDVGWYYYKKNGFDKVKATKEIESLGIIDIKLNKNKLTIELQYVGLLIGHKGENINNLKEYLTQEFPNIKIYLIEKRNLHNLYGFQY